jgi:hypothetical protein
MEGFCWYTFQVVGYALLDIIPKYQNGALSRGFGKRKKKGHRD